MPAVVLGAPASVVGTVADGAAVADAPVLIGGSDGMLVRTVTVKPPSTSAVAADKPMVVTLHPNTVALPITFTPSGARTGVSTASLALGGGTSGALVVMRTTPYTEPASAAQRSVSSANANDTAAGTGARTIRITYFDNTGAGPFTEDKTLNGVTAVATTATTIRFIEKIEVLTAGSGGVNAGVITLWGNNAGGGGTIGTIGVGNIVSGLGDNITLWAHHYTPTLYTVDIAVSSCSVQSGGSPTSAKYFLRVVSPLVANSAERLIGDVILLNGTYQRAFDFHPSAAGFCRLTGYGVPSVNNATLSFAFDWSEQPT